MEIDKIDELKKKKMNIVNSKLILLGFICHKTLQQ